MPPADGNEPTGLLRRVRAGDREAVDLLFARVYQELRDLARGQRGRWDGNPTLGTTVLVHEAYLKLVGQDAPDWRDRAHFMAVASRAMRHILIDYARRRRAQKRGGRAERISLEAIEASLSARNPEARDEALLALEDSLERLTLRSERQGRIVECRFFGGMTIEETAEALDVSPATVKRGWAMAQAWLYRDLEASLGRGAGG